MTEEVWHDALDSAEGSRVKECGHLSWLEIVRKEILLYRLHNGCVPANA